MTPLMDFKVYVICIFPKCIQMHIIPVSPLIICPEITLLFSELLQILLYCCHFAPMTDVLVVVLSDASVLQKALLSLSQM